MTSTPCSCTPSSQFLSFLCAKHTETGETSFRNSVLGCEYIYTPSHCTAALFCTALLPLHYTTLHYTTNTINAALQVQQCTAFQLDARPAKGRLQARLLEMNLMAASQVHFSSFFFSQIGQFRSSFFLFSLFC